ncbi:acyl-CoA dehydrogenase family protein [Parvularcula lutaonensis]|uniref:Acyl-CoA dehydrogenase family protein n=1 Tax=Parvularcula lutaonensis TaxID=491923 RepID=A0ABV7MG77_9PROT|nr:acyl-CoA dehydrogenase family protein [Parvularcula lutaonensis]GGY54584.1 acyl-CoA dehydrogenase [Parvularcula lutaonensis]
MTDLETFRQETRAWLEENCPQSMRGDYTADDACWGGKKWVFKSEDQKVWLERMAEKGWTVPTWPKEYGGGGLTKEENEILREEMKRIKAFPPHENFGISMLGPALLKFGTHEQKAKFLPPIARGEIRWCQGYSEPGSGSDLASLKTKAEDKGDHWLVNGQKVWTSYADQADWIFCLTRTDNSGPKHQGITFMLFSMESEGVSTKPIKLISGRSPFCETFLDDVKVPKTGLEVVGEIGEGWRVATYLLTHEREMISGMFGGGATRFIGQIAAQELGTDENGAIEDDMLRARAAQADLDGWAFLTLMKSIKDRAEAGDSLGAMSSALKYYGTELNKRRYELMMDIGGSDELEWETDRNKDGDRARSWLRTRANSIEGGTSEIQLNIIAKRILELPS